MTTHKAELLQAGPPYPDPVIRLARPDLGPEEVEAVTRVLSSSVLTNGPETASFERAFADRHESEFGVAFANGTLALVAMFAALGIGPGDEVVVPSLSFVSSATSVSLVGAQPIFAEIDPLTFNLDPTDVQRRLTPRTKAVLAVHYGGQASALQQLNELTKDAGIALLEDAAEAHGASYLGRSVGSWGRAAMFSFTPTKNITTGEGGLVTTSDGDLAKTLRLLRNHGQTALYRHELLGWNMRITEMQAAIGSCQLRKLDDILARKHRIADRLSRRLTEIPGIEPPYQHPGSRHVHMLYTTKVSHKRDDLLHALRQRGVEARIYFPPIHQQPIYQHLGVTLPVTEHVASSILSLPCHSLLEPAEIEILIDAVRNAMASL